MSPLIITCPHCGEDLDAVQAVAEGEHREYLELLAGFGPARPVVVAYLDLFRAAPGSAMRIATRLRLVRELHRLWDGETFSYNRQVHRISRAQIGEALHDVVRAKRTGTAFVNHNYLKQVMLSKLNASERQERRQEARAEADLEQQRRSRRAPGPALTHPRTEDELRREADREAAEARARGELPIHEQSLEAQAYALATYMRSPLLRHNGPFALEMRQNLARAGVDLAALARLARERPPQPEDGPLLLAACRRAAGDLTPVGDSLPALFGGDDDAK